MAFEKTRSGQFFRIFAPILLVTATPFFTSIHVYLSNSAEFSTPVTPLILFNSLFFGIILLLLLLAAAFLPRAYRTYFLSVLAGLGVVFWIQANLLNWDYGVLTGAPIDWGSYSGRLIMDLSVWAAVLLGFLISAKKIRHHLVFLSIVLIAVQLASVSYSYVRFYNPPSHLDFAISEKDKMTFSPDKNIVILLLDGFQSDVFQQIIDHHPQYADTFAGFTFFRNATAQYSKTYGAIPALLTGHWYENRQPVEKFLNEAFNDAVSTLLLKNGWLSQLYPLHNRIIGYSEKYASNIESKMNAKALAADAGRLLDIGFFRASPQPLKPFWLNDFQWRFASLFPRYMNTETLTREKTSESDTFFHPVQKFVHQSRSELKTGSLKPAFKFFHFDIPHAPFVLNQDLAFERLPATRDGFVRYSMAALESVRLFLEALKNQEIFDQTMIFVLSDHGGGEYQTGIRNKVIRSSGRSAIASMHHESGLPLVLAKPFFSEKEKLTISDAPVSLGDIAPTISRAAELNQDFKGYDIFSIPPDLERTRRYLFYSFDGWEHDYLPDMTEYEITGHAWDPSNWQATGKILFPPDEYKISKAERSPGLSPGKRYFFSDDIPTGFTASGWSFPETNGIWSLAREAVLELPVTKDLEFPVKISFWLTPYKCGGKVDSQRVRIYSQSKKPVTAWHVFKAGWYSLIVGKNALAGDTIRLVFQLPDALSPAECQTGQDERRLGISLRELKVETVDSVVSYNQAQLLQIDFSETGSSSDFLLSGWGGQETNYRWTDGPKAQIGCNLGGRPDRDLVLRVLGRGFTPGDRIRHQKIKVIANNVHIADWQMGSKKSWHTAPVPAGIIGDQGIVRLTFEISDPACPMDFGPSKDTRLLGMAVSQVVIEHDAKNGQTSAAPG